MGECHASRSVTHLQKFEIFKEKNMATFQNYLKGSKIA